MSELRFEANESVSNMLSDQQRQLNALLKQALKKDAQVKNMAPQDILDYISELHLISDKLSDFMREIDRRMAQIRQDIISDLMRSERKISASLVNSLVSATESELKADKDWADRALKQLNSMRITALSAKKSID